jgi:hypothetical protein
VAKFKFAAGTQRVGLTICYYARTEDANESDESEKP